jgi:HK97 gp10 family phage protein
MAYESNIPKAKNNIKCSISTGMDAVSKKVLDDVKDNLLRQGAKDTGQLLNSYKIVQTEDAFEIGSDLDYSLYVEFGTGMYAEDGKGVSTPWAYKNADGKWYTTKGMRPRPHIRPAFENNAEEIEMMLAKELKDIE